MIFFFFKLVKVNQRQSKHNSKEDQERKPGLQKGTDAKKKRKRKKNQNKFQIIINDFNKLVFNH